MTPETQIVTVYETYESSVGSHHSNGSVFIYKPDVTGAVSGDPTLVFVHEGKHSSEYWTDREKWEHDHYMSDELTDEEKTRYPNNSEKNAIDAEGRYLDEMGVSEDDPLRRDRWATEEFVKEKRRELEEERKRRGWNPGSENDTDAVDPQQYGPRGNNETRNKPEY